MNKAIFLDRDGTINRDLHYLCHKEDFIFLPGVIKAMRSMQQAGYLLIVISNQSGIARGYYTEQDYTMLTNWMNYQLLLQQVVVDRQYYCPHHPQAIIEQYRLNCDCRKPGLGLFRKAISDFDIDLSQSYAIGDRLRDCQICEETSCKGFLIGNSESDEIVNAVKNHKYKRIRYADNLLSCTYYIQGIPDYDVKRGTET